MGFFKSFFFSKLPKKIDAIFLLVSRNKKYLSCAAITFTETMLQENDIQEYKDLYRQHFHRNIEEETAANEAYILVSLLEEILY
jgi:hypothetical protein